MPIDGSGTYTVPVGTLAVPGTTIESAPYNAFLADLVTAMNTVRPIVKGGTGATSAAAALANLGGAQKIVGEVKMYAGSSAPSGWLFCYGQAISRTTYADLYAVIGTTYGAGNGSSTFNLPDCRGRVVAGKDNMGGTSADRLTNIGGFGGVNGDILGATGGAESHALSVAQIPSHNHGGATGSDGVHNHTVTINSGGSHDHGGATSSSGAHSHDITIGSDGGPASRVGRATTPNLDTAATSTDGAHTHTISSDGSHTHTNTVSNAAAHDHTISSQGGGGAHNNIQPTIIFNMIIRT